MTEIITRTDARALGLKRYFTGKPCPQGHVCERYVCQKACVECVKDTRRKSPVNKAKKARDHKLYYQRNRLEVNNRNKAWWKAHPEKDKVRRHNKRARKRRAEGSHTAEEIEVLIKKQKHKCAICFKKRKLTIDHIIPLAKGGTNYIINIQMACRPCNSKKNAKDPILFANEIGRLL